MKFDECELAILRNTIDKAGNIEGKKLLNNPEIVRIIEIVESFLKNKKRICYGGTAINNILPEEDKFYNKEIELPDYDFFSPDPLNDAKTLADIYYKEGFEEVEAKAGAHAGTFKVFVNFIPVADITFMDPKLYKSLIKKAVQLDGIFYSPPNYLRMLMYLELSRPAGNISRWEKVLKRITLLNKNYPLEVDKICDFRQIARPMGSALSTKEQEIIFDIVQESFISQGLVFFGAMANEMYKQHIKNSKYKLLSKIPDFDVLSTDPLQSATILKERLKAEGFKRIILKKQSGLGDIIAPHYEIKVQGETIAIIYEPLACHSFNIIKLEGKKIRVATIDTMLSFYLAFLHVNKDYYDPKRILCMSQYLFKAQQANRLEQKGILKRFSIDCYGEQLTIEMMRAKKANKYKELKYNRNSKEWDWYFYKYSPGDKYIMRKKKSTRKQKAMGKQIRKPKRNKTRKKKGRFSDLPRIFGF